MKQLKISAIAVLLMVSLSQLGFAQPNGCTTSNGVAINVKPEAPLQFQFFPVSLLGIGGGDANVSAFQNFGIQFTNNSGSEQRVDIRIGLLNGGQNIFSRNMEITLTVPVGGPYFVSTPQLLNTSFGGAVRKFGSATKASISQDFINSLKGGLPSGTFIFTVEAGPDRANYSSCGQITVQILTGATVDLISPSEGSQASSLPQFQWTAIGGRKFRLNVAKLKSGQTAEEALANSSQRFRVVLSGNSYQALSGGPVNTGLVQVLENNLTWNPGLSDGEYVYRVTMIQEDPITGTSNEVRSANARFVVSGAIGGMVNTSGLNTIEIIGLLQSAAKGVDIKSLLSGFDAMSITINGDAATVDDLRAKLTDLPASVKWSIKP